MDKAMTEPRLRPTLAGFTIADTNRPTGPAIEQGIFSPEIQIGIVEQQPDRNRTNLPALGFPESLIKRMWQPAVCTLNLAGDGELIVLSPEDVCRLSRRPCQWKSVQYRRGDNKTFQHDCSSQIKNSPPAPDDYPVADEE
jgi:hypothetical protein